MSIKLLFVGIASILLIMIFVPRSKGIIKDCDFYEFIHNDKTIVQIKCNEMETLTKQELIDLSTFAYYSTFVESKELLRLAGMFVPERFR